MLKMVKRSRKGIYTANIKFLGVRFGGRLTAYQKQMYLLDIDRFNK